MSWWERILHRPPQEPVVDAKKVAQAAKMVAEQRARAESVAGRLRERRIENGFTLAIEELMQGRAPND